MKKAYIAPELTVVKVEVAHLICESTLETAQETTSQANNGEGITEADARRYSVWDDGGDDW